MLYGTGIVKFVWLIAFCLVSIIELGRTRRANNRNRQRKHIVEHFGGICFDCQQYPQYVIVSTIRSTQRC